MHSARMVLAAQVRIAGLPAGGHAAIACSNSAATRSQSAIQAEPETILGKVA
jgi:hypothetical protein